MPGERAGLQPTGAATKLPINHLDISTALRGYAHGT